MADKQQHEKHRAGLRDRFEKGAKAQIESKRTEESEQLQVKRDEAAEENRRDFLDGNQPNRGAP